MSIAVLLPLLLVFLLIAGYVKLAARLLKKHLAWGPAFGYAGLIALLALLRGLTGLSLARVMPTVLAGVIGLVIAVAIGAWFFAGRARNADGSPLGTRGALLLTALALGLSFIVGALLFFAVTLAWR